ncbi:hypothetical protein MTR_6g037230 [Medicago truncatula]|uniref:Uncharacterized protein n=1 Tax=Medicago truncatula TaxID=3880 RepID=A0A072UJB7_MEDTR|nr:hypothetical protein MTR_6g037230 [Medicago truncatula]
MGTPYPGPPKNTIQTRMQLDANSQSRSKSNRPIRMQHTKSKTAVVQTSIKNEQVLSSKDTPSTNPKYPSIPKLKQEAWSILSDKDRRAAYDEKIKAKPQKGSTIFGGSSTKATTNRTNNSKKKTPSSGKTHKNTAKEPTSSFVNTSKSTFWTTCHRCHMH